MTKGKKEKEKKPYLGTVKVGPKGQIVIPKEVREMFEISTGDFLVVLAHPKKGIAIERPRVLNGIADAIFDGRGAELFPVESKENLEAFAEIITENVPTTEKEKGEEN